MKLESHLIYCLQEKVSILDKCFNKFSQEAKNNVKIATMEMYDPYVQLIKRHFKNEKIVFDKFHIVQNFTRALNITRIKYTNTLNTNRIEYKRLRRYWKSLTSFKVKASNVYYKLPLYDYKTNMSDVVDNITSKDEILSNTYNFYQLFFTHLINDDVDLMAKVIPNYKDKVSEKMITGINTFLKYEEYCKEPYKTKYSNALTESLIQKIKLIKRIAYGFKDFRSLRSRVLYYFKTIDIREQLTKIPSQQYEITLQDNK